MAPEQIAALLAAHLTGHGGGAMSRLPHPHAHPQRVGQALNPVSDMPGRPRFAWGGQMMSSPEEAVAFMLSRGLHTTTEQFLANHPTIAALFPSRVAGNGRGARGSLPRSRLQTVFRP